MKREHGKHNHAVCNKLHVTTDIPCNDWIITTAFYSAIHFLDHLIFPCEYKGQKFNNINEAHKYLNKQSKHQSRSHIVDLKLPSQSINYTYLMSQCWNARYVDYNINEAISNLAVKKLKDIMKECDVDKK